MPEPDWRADPPAPERLAALAVEVVPGGVIEFERQLGGGLDATMDVLVATDRAGAVRKMVLRRYRRFGDHRDLPQPRKESATLGLLVRNGLPVPEPLWVDENDIFDETALLMSYVDGISLMRPDDPLDWSRQQARFLVDLHAIPVDAEVRSILEDNRDRMEQRMSDAERPKEYRTRGSGVEIWNAVVEAFADTTRGDTTILHTDFWAGNTLWNGQDLAAVVDWDWAALGDPLMDVSYAAMDLRFQGWDAGADEFVRVYGLESGRDMAGLSRWDIHYLARAFPYVEQWSVGLQELGREDLTPETVRTRHTQLVHRFLG